MFLFLGLYDLYSGYFSILRYPLSHGSLIFIEVFKIYKLLNLPKLGKLFFVGSPIVTTLGGSWAVITAVYMVLFGLNFGQNRPFFALQKSNFGFAFENERTVRYGCDDGRISPTRCAIIAAV